MPTELETEILVHLAQISEQVKAVKSTVDRTSTEVSGIKKHGTEICRKNRDEIKLIKRIVLWIGGIVVGGGGGGVGLKFAMEVMGK